MPEAKQAKGKPVTKKKADSSDEEESSDDEVWESPGEI